MPEPPLNRALVQLREFLATQSASRLSDEQLLNRFLARREEAAFAVLMKRHGPMVLGVCKSVLRHTQDAEDACQATFLVLARRAASIHKKASIASWLHGVAYRMSKKLQKNIAKRTQKRATEPATREPVDELSWREVNQIVHEELERLPETYRLPVILCYLEGQTQEQAARRLAWPAATVKGRLDRGRAMLHRRLTRRGVALASPLVVVCLAPKGAVGGLATATARAAVALLAGEGLGQGISSQAATLAKQGMSMAMITKAKIVLASFLAVAVAATAAAPAVYRTDDATASQTAANGANKQRLEAVRRGVEADQQNKPLLDSYGDALPASAVARLGTARFRYEGDIQGDHSLVFSRDDRILAASTIEGIVVLWDVATGQELRRFDSGSPHPPMDLSPDCKTLAIYNGDLTLYEIATGNRHQKVNLSRFERKKGNADRIRYSPDGKTIAVLASETSSVHTLWLVDVAKGESREEIVDMLSAGGLAFSPDSRTLAVAATRYGVRLYDVAAGKLLRDIDARADGPGLHPIAFSPDGRVTALGTSEGVTLIEAASGKIRNKLGQDSTMNAGVAFTPDGNTLIASHYGKGGGVNVWDVQSGKKLWEVRGDKSMALSTDGKTIATVEPLNSKLIRFWDVASGQEKDVHPGHDGTILATVISPDGKRIVTGGENNQVHVWDAATGKHLRLLMQMTPSSLAFSPNGKLLGATGAKTTQRADGLGTYRPLAQVWDTSAGDVDFTLANGLREFLSVAFFPSGAQMITGNYTKNAGGAKSRTAETNLEVWDVATRQSLQRFDLENLYPKALAVSPDGRTVAVGGPRIDKSDKPVFLLLLDTKTGAKTPLLGHGDFVLSVAVSPDGRYMVSGSQDKTARLWEVATGKERLKLEGHQHAVAAVAISPDGRIVVTADGASETSDAFLSVISFKPFKSSIPNEMDPKSGYCIRLWDSTSGKEIGRLKGHGASVTSLAFSPDGTRLVSGLYNGSALVWDVSAVGRAK